MLVRKHEDVKRTLIFSLTALAFNPRKLCDVEWVTLSWVCFSSSFRKSS